MAVAIEIQRRGQTDITVQAIESTPWLTVMETPLLEKLRQSGMYLSDRILNRALSLVGEG